MQHFSFIIESLGTATNYMHCYALPLSIQSTEKCLINSNTPYFGYCLLIYRIQVNILNKLLLITLTFQEDPMPYQVGQSPECSHICTNTSNLAEQLPWYGIPWLLPTDPCEWLTLKEYTYVTSKITYVQAENTSIKSNDYT